MDLYLLRHASAGEHLANPKQDEKRPLDELGNEQAKRMGRVLAEMDVKLDAIISSPLTRAMQTAALAAEELGFEKSMLLDGGLRPDAEFEQFRDLLRRHGKQKAILVVGHNPTLSEFLSLLVSDEAANSTVELKKGALAKVVLKGRRPILQWILTPKMVEKIQDASASKSRPKTSRK
jgi:phosphohistidine phosphatase